MGEGVLKIGIFGGIDPQAHVCRMKCWIDMYFQSEADSTDTMISAWMTGVKQKSKLVASPSFDPNEEYYGYNSGGMAGDDALRSLDEANGDRISNVDSDKDYRKDENTADKDYRYVLIFWIPRLLWLISDCLFFLIRKTIKITYGKYIHIFLVLLDIQRSCTFRLLMFFVVFAIVR